MSLDVYLTALMPTEVYERNITHNLGNMAAQAGIYEYLWRPEEVGIMVAGQLIVPLQEGLKELESNPDKYKEFNPDNGWGSYEGLVDFVREYLGACQENPSATIQVSR